jgi:hypothetical protein
VAYQDFRVTSAVDRCIEAWGMNLRGRRPQTSDDGAGRIDEDLGVTPVEDLDHARIERRLATLFIGRPQQDRATVDRALRRRDRHQQ